MTAVDCGEQNPDMGLYSEVFTQTSATAFVLKPTHRFWSDTTAHCPGRLIICISSIGLLTADMALDPLTTDLLVKQPPLPTRSQKAHSWATE